MGGSRRVRKDLVHALVGRTQRNVGFCPRCRVDYLTICGVVRDNNPDNTWTQPHVCQGCGFKLTLHFTWGGLDQWRVSRVMLGVKYACS